MNWQILAAPLLTGFVMLGVTKCDGQRETVAVLSTEVSNLKSDVAEVKQDVKTLLKRRGDRDE